MATGPARVEELPEPVAQKFHSRVTGHADGLRAGREAWDRCPTVGSGQPLPAR